MWECLNGLSHENKRNMKRKFATHINISVFCNAFCLRCHMLQSLTRERTTEYRSGYREGYAKDSKWRGIAEFGITPLAA
jgi:hypothetical protein